MPVDGKARRAGSAPGTVTVSPHSSLRGASSPGWPGSARSAARSWRCRSAAQPQGRRQLAEALERRPLVAGDAGHLDERGGVAGERGGVDPVERRRQAHGVASSCGRAVTGGSDAAWRALRSALVIART